MTSLIVTLAALAISRTEDSRSSRSVTDVFMVGAIL